AARPYERPAGPWLKRTKQNGGGGGRGLRWDAEPNTDGTLQNPTPAEMETGQFYKEIPGFREAHGLGDAGGGRAGGARRDGPADRPQVAKIAQVMGVSVAAMYRSRRGDQAALDEDGVCACGAALRQASGKAVTMTTTSSACRQVPVLLKILL